MAEVMEFVEVVVFIEFIEVVEVIEFIELMHTLEFIAEMRRENVQGNSRVHRILFVYMYDLYIRFIHTVDVIAEIKALANMLLTLPPVCPPLWPRGGGGGGGGGGGRFGQS